ncbi:MAG: acetyl-CoA carboxylase biotin carboxylase subunit [Candidatus Oleimicrobiaceae bacterium]
MISKILVANRGEIAVRLIRACRELGISSVAVFSEADAQSLHVQMADEAIPLGPSPPLQSYLDMDKIIAVAKQVCADAIHPGYGFLAENAQFVRRCEEEGIIFIGPSSAAMALVGDKVEARRTVEKAGVPTIPGMIAKSTDPDFLEQQARAVGFPLLVKASAGGGGKGMRLVRSSAELRPALEAGIREATTAFGDGSLYLERYLEEPHHVEFQVLADHHGKAVHLFERECSVQRRYQKIVEETPSPALTNELRAEMAEAALQVIKACSYTNAGTVEFLVDSGGRYYFLEVNARIQVEHPITELVTGIDLVRQQILIASGERMRLRQEELCQRGHAIECRIYAEDPEQDFLPSFGKILLVHEPCGPGIRNDSGIYSGFEVSMHYDPLLAKLIAWGEDREQARLRMRAALAEYAILGIRTQIRFLRALIDHPAFIAGQTTTDFIARHFPVFRQVTTPSWAEEAALAAVAISEFESAQAPPPEGRRRFSPWLDLGSWEIGQPH